MKRNTYVNSIRKKNEKYSRKVDVIYHGDVQPDEDKADYRKVGAIKVVRVG